MNSPLSALFARLKREGRAAFIPYITAGDPSLDRTAGFLETLAAAGADLVELGVPFSDPMADGPVNQRSAQRALEAGTNMDGILAMVSRFRQKHPTPPIILFTYYNPLLRRGLERFAEEAKAAGIQGALVVDLPPEEAGDYRAAMRKAGLDTVFLASPTTTARRLRLIDEASTGFVYYVSRLGVTGAQNRLSEHLAEELTRLRRHVKKPIAVGFGISTPEQAGSVAGVADGVVVGSAIVRHLEDNPPRLDVEQIKSFTARIGNP